MSFILRFPGFRISGISVETQTNRPDLINRKQNSTDTQWTGMRSLGNFPVKSAYTAPLVSSGTPLRMMMGVGV